MLAYWPHPYLTVTLGSFSTEHPFIVVDHLSVPAILGCDFLREHGFVLNFESGTITEQIVQAKHCPYV